jgi:tRNA dimethylallyltransferase
MASGVHQSFDAPLYVLSGSTASGKAAVAVHLAQAENLELISVDSMKVYRDLDIGTAKAAMEIRERVPFHLVDMVDSQDVFSLARYLDAAHAAVADIQARGRRALFVGGTPLYLRGLLYGIFDGPDADWDLRRELQQRAEEEGSPVLHAELAQLDPKTADRLHPNDLKRIVRALEVVRTTGQPISAHQRQHPSEAPAVPCRMVAVRRGDDDMHARIDRRTERMFEMGLVDEVRGLEERDGFNRSTRKAIGYREVLAYLRGEATYDATVDSVKRNTWRLARKQRTWLRSFPGVRWLDVAPDEETARTAERAREMLFGAESAN